MPITRTRCCFLIKRTFHVQCFPPAALVVQQETCTPTDTAWRQVRFLEVDGRVWATDQILALAAGGGDDGERSLQTGPSLPLFRRWILPQISSGPCPPLGGNIKRLIGMTAGF